MKTNGRPYPDDLLSALHDGELSAAERATAEQLLDESAEARAELDDYRSLSELVRGLPSASAPQDLRRAVMERIEQSSVPALATKPGRSRRRRRGLMFVGGGLAAAVGLIVAIALRDQAGPGAHQLVADRNDNGAVETPNEAGFETRPAVERFELAERDAGGADGRKRRQSPIASRFELAERDAGGALPDEGVREFFSADEESLPASAELVIGRVFSYLEQTEEGDVVVVEATVVDVHQALNQFQILLNKNSIPTAAVAHREDYVRVNEEFGLSDTSGELAVFIESDPSQINATLLDLGRELGLTSNYFVDLQVTGVIEASPSEDAASSRLDRLDRGAAVADRVLDVEAGTAEEMPESGGESGVAGQARASVPSGRFRRGAAEAEPSPAAPALEAILPNAPDMTEPPVTEPPVPEPANRHRSNADAVGAPAADAYKFGYQTVLNVSKSGLKKQLQAQETGERLGEQEQRYLYFGAEQQTRLKQADDLAAERELVRQRQGQAGQSMLAQQAAQQVRRRHRLLVVLEPTAGALETLKAKADSSSAPPVEAPQPPRKKG